MSKTKSSTTRRLARAGFAAGAASSLLVAALATPAYAANVPVTLSQSTGPSNGTPTITASASSAWLVGVTNPAISFSVPACVSTYTSAMSTSVTGITTTAGNLLATSVRKLTDNKLAVTVPAGVQLATPTPTTGTTKYNVCIYASSTAGAPQIGNSTYSVAAAAAITGVSPSAAPSVGGTTVTVSGTNLPTTAAGFIGLTVGGASVPVSNITPAGPNSFAFVAPARAAGKDVMIELTTAAGPARLLGQFTYLPSIVAAPNTASNKRNAVDVNILGSNFVSMNFVGGFNDANAHVYLVNGKYDPTNSTGKTNAGIAECLNVFVVSDEELICTLNLTQQLDKSGNVTLTTRSPADIVTTAGSPNISSATANFTAADIGKQVTAASEAKILYGSTIISVQSPTQATISTNGVADGTGLTAAIGGTRSVAATGSAASKDLTSSALFTQRDVGRPVSGAGVDAGSHIVSVSANGNTATLNRTPTGNVAGPVTVGSQNPVPNDTYYLTVVNNGAVDAQTQLTYQESLVSSASAFTVADF
ncbi:IPT/TIG domain-containing protein [Actinoplanes sp. Pm04-4]|uniref:IPT/TIG domain-containing protein n=1 Tax=Paractinoplanes pyxinae TaxID=2997416 RepID=A0ABT4BFN4_9ACTN|nr:IPT/TIG domain-containing protein [Actinoplanes pyxinae]MCY1145358.1 IPT/TIG domain-containing protein [Actinoplanes pyxinae]